MRALAPRPTYQRSAARHTQLSRRLSIREEPAQSAKAAGLRYVCDSAAGIRRVRRGRAFRYLDHEDREVRKPKILRRIQSLAIPPAWEGVWICSDERGHLQATGRDARGRKQHLYHPDWRAWRDQTKYDRMLLFGNFLPLIRRRTESDLRRPGLPREKVLAVVLRLLQATLIRVGNEEYAKHNHSYGLTTLRDRHAKIARGRVSFRFRGKSGVDHRVDLDDRRLARVVKQCQDLPGQVLFQCLDPGGEVRCVGSADVNQYLRELTGLDFTAKDFRTWAGTVLAACALCRVGPFASAVEAKRNVNGAIAEVSKLLGNTRTICRKCYVHPRVIECYQDGTLGAKLRLPEPRAALRAQRGLSSAERAVLRFLTRHGNGKV